MKAVVPDCDSWRETLTQHARQLSGAGVDHVVVDMVRALNYGHNTQLLALQHSCLMVDECGIPWNRLI